ncbi:MAG: response regulator [Chloroflexi bacterium]|nr:response regulator [Chloroflexota bacterium]
MHVVHLEDDSPLSEVLKIALTATEPRINLKQFTNSDAAMAYIEEHLEEIDLYVLDIRVPGQLNGLEVAQQVRERGGSGAIVLTSAYTKPDQSFLNDSKVEWMPKPWHILDVPSKLFSLVK